MSCARAGEHAISAPASDVPASETREAIARRPSDFISFISPLWRSTPVLGRRLRKDVSPGCLARFIECPPRQSNERR